jgi:hypothetical protein
MLPEWRLIRILLIIFVLQFSLIPTSLAIGVGFSVSDSSGSVGISDQYFVDDDISVHETGSGGFSPASISSSREISGSGNTSLMQKYRGSGGYQAYNYLSSKNASSVGVKSSASLSPATLSLSQSASFLNSGQIKFCLGACRGPESVRQYGELLFGSLHMDQYLGVNNGLIASIDADMDAQNAVVRSNATDALGSRAETEVEITKGRLTTSQIAKVLSSPGNIMAMASQSSNLFALNAIARSSSSSYTGNSAGVSVQVADGKMLTDQNAWADKLARADEISKVWDAAGASSYSYAKNGEGDQVYSKVSANLSNGTFNSKQIALANNNLDLWHLADASRALSTTSYAYALVRDRYLAKVYTDTKMDLGNFKTDLGANVNKTINRGFRLTLAVGSYNEVCPYFNTYTQIIT